jgi:uncharacterized protein YjbI with pentapeptide repeats
MTKQDLLQRISKSLGLIFICIIIIVGEVFATEGNPTFRCTGDTVSADTIVACIKANYDIYMDSCVIIGDITLDEHTLNIKESNIIRAEIRIESTIFTGSFVINDLVFERPISLTNNKFIKGCCLMAAIFKSSVSFTNSEFREEFIVWVSDFRHNTYFDRIRFVGEAEFFETKFGGTCRFDSTIFLCRNQLSYESDLPIKTSGYAGGFEETQLLEVNFQGADLGGAMFEPDTMSVLTMKSLARAKGLDGLKYINNPEQLQALRTFFRENNFRGQERQITCALKRHEQPILEKVIFDWPFEYGSNLERPFKIVACIFVLSWLCYVLLVYCLRNSGIWRITFKRQGEKLIEEKITKDLRSYSKSVRHLRLYQIARMKKEISLFFEVGKFALINAFNVGFRDFNFGSWVRLLLKHKREYEPYGWVRFAAGIQAITSVLLMALGLIFYYGRFFD